MFALLLLVVLASYSSALPLQTGKTDDMLFAEVRITSTFYNGCFLWCVLVACHKMCVFQTEIPSSALSSASWSSRYTDIIK